MLLLYRFGIFMYGLLVRILRYFNPKAQLFFEGRQDWSTKISNLNPENKAHVWFHFASLGEFEQGKPVIIAHKAKHPEIPIAISFFSPSGYEIRKNTPLANLVCYLPLDSPSNAKKFIRIINPCKIFFTKYEFWYFFIQEIHRKNIPLYLISGIFRKNQIFFRWYGGIFRKMLFHFTHIFLQDQNSETLLAQIGLQNFSFAGDTRFDSVFQNTLQRKSFDFAPQFKGTQLCLVAGSTWPPDEDLLFNFLSQHPQVKCIIAPHEIQPTKLNAIQQKFSTLNTVFHSQLSSNTPLHEAQVLIIDQIGMLSQLYQYADISYVGGGFGAGIHNTLEAIAFGAPVIFGPHYHKFIEAKLLIDKKLAISITDSLALVTAFHTFQAQLPSLHLAAKSFINEHKGATEKIEKICF